MQSEKSLRDALVDIHKQLYHLKFGVGSDGNSSVRLNEREILMTPKGFEKHKLRPEDISKLDIVSSEFDPAFPEPSSERSVHIQSYRRSPEIQALVHSHPPAAIACSLVGISFTEFILPEASIVLGPVPTCAYTLPGTSEIGEQVGEALHSHTAAVMERHGVIAKGKHLQEALSRIETLEHSAKILLMAYGVSAPIPVDPDEAQKWQALHLQNFKD